jgi:hypothetical protein
MMEQFSLEELLPLIRRAVATGSAPGDGIDDVLGLYMDRLVLFSAKRNLKTPDEAFEHGGEAELGKIKPIGPVVDLPWTGISQAQCGPKAFYGSRMNGGREQGREFRITAFRADNRDGPVTRVFLPEDDAALVRTALAEMLGDRYVEAAEPLPKYKPAEVLPRRKPRSPMGRRTLWLLLAMLASILMGIVCMSQSDAGGHVLETFGTVLIYFGYLLCLRPAERALASDFREPILFLRPFEIDGKTNLNPQGMLAQWLGVQPWGWLARLGPFGNVHPLRMIRMVFSMNSDHSEEQMALYFRRFGPFVAIGKPGEHFSPGGAERLYVTDDQWQAAVLDLLGRSQLVVLQPSLTPGVRWELEQAAAKVAPERILLCLTWFAGSQAKYDDFRLHFVSATALHMPRSLGDGNFACFDSQGRGRLLPLQLRTPFLWPITGCAVNFEKTLRPFFAEMRRQPCPAVPKPDGFSWFMQGAIAVLFWLGCVFVVHLIGAFGVTMAKSTYDTHAAQVQAAPDAEHAIVESGPGWAWELPSGWTHDTHDEPSTGDHLYTLGDDAAVMCTVFDLKLGEHFQNEMDAAAMLDSHFTDLKSNGIEVTGLTTGPVTVNGLAWMNAEHDVKVNGLNLHYIVRTVSTPSVRVVLIGWADQSKFEQYRRIIEDALDHMVIR